MKCIEIVRRDKIKWPFLRGGSCGEVALIGDLTVLILHIRYLA